MNAAGWFLRVALRRCPCLQEEGEEEAAAADEAEEDKEKQG